MKYAERNTWYMCLGGREVEVPHFLPMGCIFLGDCKPRKLQDLGLALRMRLAD